MSSQAQRQKISFLENNLDQLTKVQSVNQFIDIRQLKGWITQPHTQSQCKCLKSSKNEFLNLLVLANMCRSLLTDCSQSVTVWSLSVGNR